MTATDWVTEMFPGNGFELPSDTERDLADNLVAQWNERWNENHPPIPRTYPDVTDEGYANFYAGNPTNRAYLRSQLRRCNHDD